MINRQNCKDCTFLLYSFFCIFCVFGCGYDQYIYLEMIHHLWEFCKLILKLIISRPNGSGIFFVVPLPLGWDLHDKSYLSSAFRSGRLRERLYKDDQICSGYFMAQSLKRSARNFSTKLSNMFDIPWNSYPFNSCVGYFLNFIVPHFMQKY